MLFRSKNLTNIRLEMHATMDIIADSMAVIVILKQPTRMTFLSFSEILLES